MNDAFEPRENDHLVEPMFDALRADAARRDESRVAEEASSDGVRRSSWVPWVLAVLGVVLAVAVAIATR